MKTFYDLCGAQAGDDAEAREKAFRSTVKAHHPDLRHKDPGAPSRLGLRSKKPRAIALAVGVLAGGLGVLLAETTGAQPVAPTNPASPPEPGHQSNRVEVPPGPIDPSVTAPAVNSSGPRTVTENVPAPDDPSNDADVYRKRGIAAFRSGDFHRAITELDQAIRLDPNDARARNIRGNALDEIGAFERALADYDEAIRIDPNNPAVFHDRAILWRRRGALDKALVDLDRAVRFSFADAHIYCDRGLVWYEKGRHDRAVADFNRAVEIDSKFVSAYLGRGLTMYHSSE